jgi:hypothetical protein
MTYTTSPNYWAARKGAKGKSTKLSVAEAKKRWPHFSEEIDRAVECLGRRSN